jgi:LruC domain-containing protein
MNLQKFLILIFVLTITFAGCRKIDTDTSIPSTSLTMKDLVIPEGFNWETYSDIKLNIGVETSQPMTLISKVSVFNGHPNDGGKMLVSGGASSNKNFEASLRVPAGIKEVYLMCEFPFGLNLVEKVPVSDQINFTFSDVTDNGNLKSSAYKASTETGPDCEDCDVYITTGGSHTIQNGLTYCINNNIASPISITYQNWSGGGTLQVCGSATISSIGFTENAKLVVTQNGSLTINSVNTSWGNNTIMVYENATLTFNTAWSTQGQSVENQGTMNVFGNFTAQNLTSGNFINSGIMNVTGRFWVNGSSMSLTNNGTINHSGQSFRIVSYGSLINNSDIFINTGGLEISSNGSLHNSGSINVTGNIQINAGSQIINHCTMICTNDFINNSSSFVNNSGYLKAGNKFNMNSTGSILLNNSSMISAAVFEFNQGQVTGAGSTSSVKVSEILTINSLNPKFDGNIEVATDNLNLASNTQVSDHFINGASVVGLDFITNSIPAGPCNPEGMWPQYADTDGDGVPDEFDDFPTDQYRAFNYQFPEPGGHITMMFEDLWPGKGDYDFNDLVISVSGSEITNADNNIVETYINLEVKAVGASFQNGFGWQYANIPHTAIEMVTGMVLTSNTSIALNANGTEAGQDSAVIIAIENMKDVINRVGGSMYNTVDNGMVGVSDIVTVHVLFGETTPLPRELFDSEVYNIFLIKNQDRGTEIHLPNRQPTNLMTYPFGESHDTSDPLTGRYYKTSSGLPWAMIIYDSFEWPLESVPIIEAYPAFATWAETGGGSEETWYKNPFSSKVWRE